MCFSALCVQWPGVGSLPRLFLCFSLVGVRNISPPPLCPGLLEPSDQGESPVGSVLTHCAAAGGCRGRHPPTPRAVAGQWRWREPHAPACTSKAGGERKNGTHQCFHPGESPNRPRPSGLRFKTSKGILFTKMSRHFSNYCFYADPGVSGSVRKLFESAASVPHSPLGHVDLKALLFSKARHVGGSAPWSRFQGTLLPREKLLLCESLPDVGYCTEVGSGARPRLCLSSLPLDGLVSLAVEELVQLAFRSFPEGIVLSLAVDSVCLW